MIEALTRVLAPLQSRRAAKAVAREQLSLVKLSMPELPKRKLLAALRLQMLQFYPTGQFAFVCRRETSGQIAVWSWQLPAPIEGQEPASGPYWPEPLLEQSGSGFRLLSRASGAEAQSWLNGELQASQWFAQPPSPQEWQRFVRACAADPDQHPLPAPAKPLMLATTVKGWMRADNLPKSDPWKGWRWQAGTLALAALLFAALGAHLQTRTQLELDRQALADLRKQREASLESRAAFEKARRELDAIQALAPQLSQLELLDRVLASGVLSVAGSLPQANGPAPTPTPGANAVVAPAQSTAPQVAPTALFSDWEFRNQQLKITLEIPDGDIAMLDITRRIEATPGLSELKVGQDAAANTLALTMRVDSLAGVAQQPSRSGQ